MNLINSTLKMMVLTLLPIYNDSSESDNKGKNPGFGFR